MKKVEDEDCYEPSDFNDSFWRSVDEAKQLWALRIGEHIDKHGNNSYFAASGSGIKVTYLPLRHKTPKLRMIINPDLLVPPPHYPNNVALWESSAQEIVSFLKSKDIECFYWPGIDD